MYLIFNQIFKKTSFTVSTNFSTLNYCLYLNSPRSKDPYSKYHMTLAPFFQYIPEFQMTFSKTKLNCGGDRNFPSTITHNHFKFLDYYDDRSYY